MKEYDSLEAFEGMCQAIQMALVAISEGRCNEAAMVLTGGHGIELMVKEDLAILRDLRNS